MGLGMDAPDLTSLLHDLSEHDWLDRAACGQLPIEELSRFFGPAGSSPSAETLATCRSCPVRIDCLEHAYANQVMSGCFGGLTAAQRRRLSLDEARELITGSG